MRPAGVLHAAGRARCDAPVRARRRRGERGPPAARSTPAGGCSRGTNNASAPVALEGVLNFRDLAEACEGVVAPGRVYRTATVGKATVDDAGRILDDLRVTRLLDLRSADEFEDEPGPVQSAFELRAFERLSSNVNDADDGFGFDLVVADDADAPRRLVRYHTPLLDYDRYYGVILDRMSPLEKVKAAIYTAQAKLVDDTNQRRLFVGKVNEGGLRLLNEVMVDSSGPEVRAALTVVAATSEAAPLAFYCKAGKDRTGLVAALVLHCCGVSDADIVADYHRSQGVGRAALGGGRIEKGLSIDYSRFYGAPEEVMEHVLGYIRGQYGSLERYLDNVGFDAEKRRRLARALCE